MLTHTHIKTSNRLHTLAPTGTHTQTLIPRSVKPKKPGGFGGLLRLLSLGWDVGLTYNSLFYVFKLMHSESGLGSFLISLVDMEVEEAQ